MTPNQLKPTTKGMLELNGVHTVTALTKSNWRDEFLGVLSSTCGLDP